MNVLLINPPYQTLTSNLGVGHQVPLGLLMVGGALLDAGHSVRMLDAECERLSVQEIIERIQTLAPQIVMTGHAGSTPAHPVCLRMLHAIKAAVPEVLLIYGGVYPTYHAQEILAQETAIDFIIRGEGEAAGVELLAVLEHGRKDPLCEVAGISYRAGSVVMHSPNRPAIQNLDQYRIGWELIIDWDRYQCFGLGRAAILQLSRGCPHRCTYCGQHGFWITWRHRDPVRVVNEIEWLHRVHGVRFITLADENPTTLPEVWRRFLHELADRRIDVHFFATIRASDIVRDGAMLDLYRRAGILYVLMGVDTTNPQVQQQVKKNSTVATDVRACQLLKEHNIFAMLGHIVGLEQEGWRGFKSIFHRLQTYDADLLNAMYATPHAWTEFARENASRQVVQHDLAKWDYRHQVLAHTTMKPWQLCLAVKLLEFLFHLHPRKWAAWLRMDLFRKRQLVWCFLHTGAVWLAEIFDFLFATPLLGQSLPLSHFQRPLQTPLPKELHSKSPSAGASKQGGGFPILYGSHLT